MPCCMCEKYKWKDPQEVVYTDPEDGKEYCLFHAPAEHKGMGVDDFNAQVSERIQATIDLEDEEAECDLSGTIFPGKICFDKECKLLNISFYFCVFVEDVDFGEACFVGNANFREAKFGENADFSKASFGGKAYFSKASFGGVAYFDKASFGGLADFSKASFGWLADFSKASFGGLADFSKASFGEIVNFRSASFGGVAYFDKASFEGNAYFIEASFEGVTIFRAIKFKNSPSESAEDSPTKTFDFANCTIPTQKLTFKDCDDLSYLDLRGQPDLTHIRFHECSWGDNGRIQLRIEDKALSPTRDFYQRMKAKYKAENNEYEASKWHVAEKEVQLKLLAQSKGEQFNWIMLDLYKSSSGFGENPFKAFKVLLALILFPLLLMLVVTAVVAVADIQIDFFGWSFHPSPPGNMLGEWRKFIPLLGKLGSGDGPFGLLQIFIAFWQLLITLQAALFAFALRNNFRR
ncbi:pentapeptide repeat-containing protein [Pseudodesulfovibrio sp.]|uniref:pentapeptide repeat-containing protein n=1 Tax=unclassified Pseudodesulfovibrio TaxID=2661612 RepID=UPI003B00CD88